MNQPFGRFARLLALILLSVGVFGPLGFGEGAEQYPSDKELIAFLRTHRESLDQLAAMAAADASTNSFIVSPSSNSSALPKSSQDAYRKLLSSVRSDICLRVDGTLVSFSYWGGGDNLSIGRSWFKGLAIFPNGLRADVQITNQLDARPNKDGTYVVPIDDKWYIIYSQTD